MCEFLSAFVNGVSEAESLGCRLKDTRLSGAVKTSSGSWDIDEERCMLSYAPYVDGIYKTFNFDSFV